MTTNAPFVSISIDDDGTLEFGSIEAIADWINAEKSAWPWIADRSANKGPFRDTWTRYNNFFTSIEQCISQYHSDQSPEALTTRMQDAFGRHVRSKLVAITRTKHGATIQSLLNSSGGPESDVAARRAILSMTHMGPAQDNTTLNPAYIREMTLAILDYQLVGLDAGTQLAATQQAVTAANDELSKRQRALDDLRSSAEARISEWGTQVADTISNTDHQATTTIQALNDVKTTFETQMGLQAPAQYWATKATTHAENADKYRRRLIGWGALFILTTIAAYGGVLWLVVYEGVGSTNQIAAGILFFGALAVWTTGALWAARLMSRLYLSEHHLGVDAAERATMATTYLALTNQKSADEKDRAVVLAALFRPTADGIVKDDPPPMLTPAAFLAGMISPR